ncbi:HEAT repeat domain-containing protein [Stieleria sp. TO1_6]|uniref:PVC-type heme-binding CxxCH protein n=1 Tax=Stieleria tagensis TaxID=2956795 RepID=UPI00209A9194|nr:PVC-type heme-binding CxxCH protein [Stieleria tagensis]MCO8123106.1 HEAT repeat domain-containing protein [Stieleria tagensis]
MNEARSSPLLTLLLTVLLTAGMAVVASAAEVKLGKHNFQLPDGFSIQQIAGPPLVDRPICADFDDQGRLYVADSSGSNAAVEEQVKNPTHRIVRLEDSNGDGQFDKSTVFADRMMFPEGTLWHDGSLYVAAPPSIWKLTDTDDDGVADQREEWWQGQTLTHCANDLHGPYLGPDGWFYWCKGAFAEQTYEREGKPPFVTKAAHLFRCRPDAPRDPDTGSVLSKAIEPVMTGGMANPVDVTFTPGGERVFTTTFLIRPQAGLRDGLIHAIYGGVYGSQNAARLMGHQRTGDLMPPLLHMGAAAPCGLTRYESDVFGSDYRNNLFACLFNMRKVTRHVLQPNDATFNSSMEDFVVSNHLDFHPTDVIEDADGSLIVIDTGGWYKLCCPTSQLEKPDILGAIYRVRRDDVQHAADPRGLKLNWSDLSALDLAALLDDARPAVQRRAIQELANRDAAAIGPLSDVLRSGKRSETSRLGAVWALTRIDHRRARDTVRIAFDDRDPTVRQAAIHSASVHRDPDAWKELVELLQSESAHNRRAAAEALGRIGNKAAVPALLAAAGQANDRISEHSLIFALIEIADAKGTRDQLTSGNAGSRSAALMALDQMDGGMLQAADVAPLLSNRDATLKETADWIVDQHPQWAAELAPHFRKQIQGFESLSPQELKSLQASLSRFAVTDSMRELLAKNLTDDQLPSGARQLVLRAMSQSKLNELPSSWVSPLASLLRRDDQTLAAEVVSVLRNVPAPKTGADQIVDALVHISADPKWPDHLRLESLWAVRERVSVINADQFDFVAKRVDGSLPVDTRATAVEILANAQLDPQQLTRLTALFEKVSPLDINRLLAAFGRSRDEQAGLALVESLERSPARSALDLETLKRILKNYPSSVQQHAGKLYTLIESETAEQSAELQSVLASLPAGNARRGQEVFHSAKAACSACHAIGYLGGRVGPDLTRIARIRNRRDLLEAVIFPSASMVQNYESVTVLTLDGQIYNGLIQRETDKELVLATGPDKEVRIGTGQIEEVKRSSVSIMPTGLDKQLTSQQLADLVEFLTTRK